MARRLRRLRRFWTDEEKRSICFQTTAAGVSVAQVARRHAMNANMIFKWLRDPRYAPDPEAVEELGDDTPCFLPVEIVDRPRTEDSLILEVNRRQHPYQHRKCFRSLELRESPNQVFQSA